MTNHPTRILHQTYQGRLTTWLRWEDLSLLRPGMRAAGMVTEPHETGTAAQWMAALAETDRRVTTELESSFRRVCKYDVDTMSRLEHFASLASTLLPLIHEAGTL